MNKIEKKKTYEIVQQGVSSLTWQWMKMYDQFSQ